MKDGGVAMNAASPLYMPRERGVIFAAPMIRALKAGLKTQTRRVVKLPPAPNHLGQWEPTTIGGPGLRDSAGKPVHVPEQPAIWHTRTGKCIACPYGSVGDRLWVRETWSDSALHVYPVPNAWYRADFDEYADPATNSGHGTGCTGNRADCFACAAERDGAFKWRPSLFMPRHLSRITLEITNVRVERLQDISEADAWAEGLRRFTHPDHGTVYEIEGEQFGDPRRAYEFGWQGINGKRKGARWEDNPFVWCLTFRRRL